MKSIIVILIIFIFELGAYAAAPRVSRNTKVDFTQADLMLEFLSNLTKGRPVSGQIDAIKNAEGTKLILEQLNIVRKVSPDQYEQLLRGLGSDHTPRIEPVDSTERARRGVDGLTENVWVVLTWALDNTKLLSERLAELKKTDLYAESEHLARQFLPEPLDQPPALFVVMGGRAGAAALSGNRIYFDLLLMTFQSVRKNEPFTDESGLRDYFAHEMHHIGLSEYYKKKFGSLILDENQHRLLSMLKSIAAEGSATYLISDHRDINAMRTNLKLAGDPDKQESLLSDCEFLMQQLTEAKFSSQDEYEKANTLMLGHGYHTVGAIMLSSIDQTGGLESVMRVLADPRILLTEYNKAALSLSGRTNTGRMYLFNSGLVEKMRGLK